MSRLARPTDDWAYRNDERRPSVLMILMSGLLGLLALVAAVAVARVFGFEHKWLLVVELGLLVIAAGIVAGLMYQVRQHLLAPLAQLYAWALQMCDGDFSARIVSAQEGRFVKLSFHVNRLSEALDRLANEMDDVVWEQTERLQEKNQSLELLYEVVAAMHGTDSTSEVLEKATHRMMVFTTMERATIHILTDDKGLELVSSIGFESTRDDNLENVPSPPLPTTVQIQSDPRGTGKNVVVPLIYQDHSLGLIRLSSAAKDRELNDETVKLLASVGRDLGMVIAKASLDEKARNLALINE